MTDMDKRHREIIEEEFRNSGAQQWLINALLGGEARGGPVVQTCLRAMKIAVTEALSDARATHEERSESLDTVGPSKPNDITVPRGLLSLCLGLLDELYASVGSIEYASSIVEDYALAAGQLRTILKAHEERSESLDTVGTSNPEDDPLKFEILGRGIDEEHAMHQEQRPCRCEELRKDIAKALREEGNSVPALHKLSHHYAFERLVDSIERGMK